MKKLFVFAFLIFSIVNLSATGEQNIDLKPGTKLVYSLFRNGEYSNLIVTIHSLFPVFEFDYQTTSDPATKGDIKISRDAMLNADHIIYYLLGRDLNLNNSTTLWFSQKSYNDLVKTGKADITSDNGKLITVSKLTNSVKKIYTNDDTIYVNYMNAGQVLDSSDSSEVDLGDTFQILDDPNNPMILKMDVGWTVELQKVIYPDIKKP